MSGLRYRATGSEDTETTAPLSLDEEKLKSKTSTESGNPNRTLFECFE
jgi:hypothetical protein